MIKNHVPATSKNCSVGGAGARVKRGTDGGLFGTGMAMVWLVPLGLSSPSRFGTTPVDSPTHDPALAGPQMH